MRTTSPPRLSVTSWYRMMTTCSGRAPAPGRRPARAACRRDGRRPRRRSLCRTCARPACSTRRRRRRPGRWAGLRGRARPRRADEHGVLVFAQFLRGEPDRAVFFRRQALVLQHLEHALEQAAGVQALLGEPGVHVDIHPLERLAGCRPAASLDADLGQFVQRLLARHVQELVAIFGGESAGPSR